MQFSALESFSITGVGLVLGGARSGKSAFAEDLLNKSDRSKIYLATATVHDGEMADRIAHHQARRDAEWRLIEEPTDIAAVIRDRAGIDDAILIDCLTLWVTNLMMEKRDLAMEFDRFCQVLEALPDRSSVVIVSNEVGQGIVPMDPMARQFRDHVGRLHQQIARLADQVWFITAGLVQKLK